MKCGFSHFLGVKFPSYKQPVIEFAIILITTDLCFFQIINVPGGYHFKI